SRLALSLPDRRWSVSFFFSSRRRHTRSKRDWSSDVCSSDLEKQNIHILKSSCLMLFDAIGSVRSAVGSAAVAAGVFTSMMSAPLLFYFSTFAHQNKVAHSFFRFYSQLLFTSWENPSQIHAQAAVLCYTKSIYWSCPGPGPCSAIQYSSPPCRNLSQKGGRRPCT